VFPSLEQAGHQLFAPLGPGATTPCTTNGPGERLVAQEMPPPPKPGPEHEVFKLDEGTWDAAVEMTTE
jgi:hypothetical protein